MRLTSKRLARLLVMVATILLGVGFVLYSSGALPALPFWWQRSIMAPSPEDYAAYSGFVDDFFSSRQPFRGDQSVSTDNIVLIGSETTTMKNTSDPILPLEVAALGPEDMGEDFFRQNSKTWHLEAQFRSQQKWTLVDSRMLKLAAMSGEEELFAPPKKGDAAKWLPHADPSGPFPENPKVCGVLVLSRIGFDHSRTRGLIYYVYRCGILCGQSGWATLRKVRGEWKLDGMGGTVVY